MISIKLILLISLKYLKKNKNFQKINISVFINIEIKKRYLSIFFYQYNQQEQVILVLVLSFFPYIHSNFISFAFNFKRILINNIPMRKYSLWEKLSTSQASKMSSESESFKVR